MKIGNKERPIKWGINQTDLFCVKRGIGLSDYYKQFTENAHLASFGVIRDLLWSALKDGARQADEEFPFDNLTIGDWMDEDPLRFMQETMDGLNEGNPKPQENGEAKKKVKAVK